MADFFEKNLKENEGGSGTAKTFGSGAKPNIENASKPRTVLYDIGNTMAEGGQSYQVKCEPGNENLSEDKNIEFRFRFVGLEGKHVVKGKADDTIYSALMAMAVVKRLKEKNPNKELHLVDQQDNTGFVNLGMPLKCLKVNTTFDMHFYPFGQKCTEDGNYITERYRKYEGAANEFVIFYVRAKAKQIILSNALRTSRYSLCVFAPKGESLQDAIYSDGRFCLNLKTTDWQMVEDGTYIHYPVNAVDGYDKKTLEVEIVKQKGPKKAPAAANQSSKHSTSPAEKTLQCFDQPLLDQYPSLKEQGEVIEELLKAEAERQKKRPQTVLKLEKEEYGKKVINSTLVRVHNMLSRRSCSVGFIEWDNNGNRGSATCFLLAGPYILTNHHVVRMIVGKGVEEKHWPGIISKSARVIFTYDQQHPVSDDWFSIEPWFEIAEPKLDYALLELQEKDWFFPVGLMNLIDILPLNGLVYIIGHPDAKEKATDTCTVMPLFQRGPEISHRINEEFHKYGCNNANCGDQINGSRCIHMYTPSTFQALDNPNSLTYDTSFFHGASGAPVFNSSGRLVALHCGGYGYRIQSQLQSVIELGWSMKEICLDIERKDKGFYDSLFKMDWNNQDEYIEDGEEGDPCDQQSIENNISSDLMEVD